LDFLRVLRHRRWQQHWQARAIAMIMIRPLAPVAAVAGKQYAGGPGPRCNGKSLVKNRISMNPERTWERAAMLFRYDSLC
jgi:hypothetical protein